MIDLLAELRWRGQVHQITDEGLGGWLQAGPRTVYAGFDPTADSLHVGHLVPLLLLRRFQRAGHRPIAVVGGATGLIGDPSGRSDERNLLTLEQLAHNVGAIKRQMALALDFGPGGATLVDNYEWTKDFTLLDFLRDIGKCFSVSAMLAKDSVKSRLDREDGGISFTEFSYMLLQAYDFAYLARHYGCELQVGGSDQWGNITAGIDLARRLDGRHLYGLTMPLLTKADGSKMGKTASGAVWLDPQRTSPYAFYQYWVNIDDADVGKCLRIFTDLSRDEIEALDQERAERPHQRASQKRLAEELTRLIHQPEGLARALRATEVLFGAEIDQVSDSELGEIFADVPSHEVARSELVAGYPLVDALVVAGLAASKGEARRLIQQGGAAVNNRKVTDVETRLGEGHLASETVLVLRQGKKRYALVRFV
jgi:tyrosyl-tRNA synthetase